MNAPKAPVSHYHKDGSMNFFGHKHGPDDAYYEPNSFGGPVEDAGVKEPPLALSGDADRFSHRIDNDDYTQPGNLFRLLSADEQKRLGENIAAAMAAAIFSPSRFCSSAESSRNRLPGWV